MILESILWIFYNLVLTILQLLQLFGSVNEDNGIAQGLATLGDYLASINLVLPIDTIVTILVFELVFETVFAFYRVIKWLYQKIPGIN